MKSAQLKSDFDFDLLAEEYSTWSWDQPWNFSTVVKEQDWSDTAPTKAEFDRFTAELGEGRCIHCGRWYEPMTASEGTGTVCEHCGIES